MLGKNKKMLQVAIDKDLYEKFDNFIKYHQVPPYYTKSEYIELLIRDLLELNY